MNSRFGVSMITGLIILVLTVGGSMAETVGGKAISVRVLGIPKCENAKKALDRVQKEADALQLDVKIERVEVVSQEQAVKERMSGSPTVLVNGLDLDPARRTPEQFGVT